MRPSFALQCLNRQSVVKSTSSCGWPSILSFRFFSTRSASCPTRIRALALNPLMEYDVVFPSIFVISFILGFIWDVSWFTTHSAAFFWDCFFRCRIFFSFTLTICLCEEKLFFICNVWGRFWHLYGCCLHILPDFEMDLLRDFWFRPGEKVSCCVDWTSVMCYFKLKLQHIFTCVP